MIVIDQNQPIFIQIMEIIENDIITDVYHINDLIISTTQIAKIYSVNPTTAVKAVSKLTDAEILYKKRGIGMCVAEGAKEKIIKRRKDVFLNQTMITVLNEAKTLGIPTDELIRLIKKQAEVSSQDFTNQQKERGKKND